MNMFICIITFIFLQMAVDALVTISADKALPRDGETVKLICRFPSFQEPASWFANDTDVKLTTCLPSGPCQPSNDARYNYSATASSIDVTITSFNSMQDTFGWKCQYGAISVIYIIKPVVPVMTVQLENTSGETLTSKINIVRGGKAYIRCSTAPHGSRPPATFRWYRRTSDLPPVLIENLSISSTPDAIMVPGQPESDLLISYSTLTQIGATMYTYMYIFCEARDEMSTGNYIQSAEVQLNIGFTPATVVTPYYSVYNVTEGTQHFVFNCNIIDSLPWPQSNDYSWFHKSIVIQGQVSSSYTIPSVQKSDDGNYTCRARNVFGIGTATNYVALNVQYPPYIWGMNSSYKVIENHPLNVTCQASSNPPPDHVFWSPSGESSVPSTLYFSSLSRNKSGTYRCTVQNIMEPTAGGPQTGINTTQIMVDVLYTATIKDFLVKGNITELMENSTFQLYCHVDSNPYSVISLAFGDVLKLMTLDSSELIYSATAGCLDAGKYICSATNSIMNGYKVSAEINLKVYCQPRLDFREDVSVVYFGALNDNITLNVSVIAYPEPTNIMWYHRAEVTEMWERVMNQSFFSTGLHSYISLHLVNQRVFGDYLVNMSNSFGIYEHIFHVIPEKFMQSPPKLNVGPIAGGVASGAIVAIIGIILIIYCIRRQRQKLRKKEEGAPLELEGKSATTEGINMEGYTTINTDASTGEENDANPYIDLQDTAGEMNESVNIRSADTVTYDALHPYLNNEDHAYSSLKQRPHQKGEEGDYEDTKRSEWS